jgi:hypothetical protein
VTISFWDPDLTGACDFTDGGYAWVHLPFDKEYVVSRAAVTWAPADEGEYASCYAVLLNRSESPNDPDPDPESGWESVYEQSSGTAEPQDIPIAVQRARSAALVLFEDGKRSVTGFETFGLAEFAVTGKNPKASSSQPDSCN